MFTSKKIKGNIPKRNIKNINLSQTSKKTEQLTRDRTKIFRGIVFAILALSIASYLIWQVWQIVTPPELVILEPSNNTVVKTSQLTIRGQVEPKAELTMNNEVILPDVAGNFFQLVNLRPGSNLFVFEAKKRYSRSVKITREVHLKEEPVVKGIEIKLTN